MSLYKDFSGQNIKVIDFLQLVNKDYDYNFIINDKVVRDDKGEPINANINSFIDNGCENILQKVVSGMRVIRENYLCNVFLDA